jgi:hypothetical protein
MNSSRRLTFVLYDRQGLHPPERDEEVIANKWTLFKNKRSSLSAPTSLTEVHDDTC